MDQARDVDDADDAPCARDEPEAASPAEPVTVHQFAVADYSLQSLDFAAPELNEVVALKVENYTLAPLSFSVPAWRWAGYVLHWHDAGSKPGGRRPDIPVDKAPRLIAATRDYLIKHQITDLKRMSETDRTALYDFVRKLAANEGIQVSDRILREQIIGPALQREVT